MLRILSGFGLITGATYPFRALATFSRNPKLWQYIAIPILVNFVVAIALYSGLLIFGFNVVGIETLGPTLGSLALTITIVCIDFLDSTLKRL